MWQVLIKKKRLHVRLRQIVLEQVPCHLSSDSEGRMYGAETVEQRVDGGWRNEDAVVQQLVSVL